MPPLNNRHDRFAFLYVQACLNVMKQSPIAAQQLAHRNLSLFSQQGIGNPRYIKRWNDLLDMVPDKIVSIVMAQTDEGQVLRSTAPFAGMLSQGEILRLRKSAAVQS